MDRFGENFAWASTKATHQEWMEKIEEMRERIQEEYENGEDKYHEATDYENGEDKYHEARGKLPQIYLSSFRTVSALHVWVDQVQSIIMITGVTRTQ